jgi:hypothetical protein
MATSIEKGDYILDGNPAPHDILAIKGVEALARYLVNEIQEVYRLQGVLINDKHIEVIVRQMLQKVEITDPGDSPTSRATMSTGSNWTRSTSKLVEEGKKPASGEPVLLGITKASLQTRRSSRPPPSRRPPACSPRRRRRQDRHAAGPEGERHRRPPDPGRYRRHR